MPAPTSGILKLIGQTVDGETSATTVEIEAVGGRIQRSAGLVADTVRAVIDAGDLWPADWDLSKAMRVQLGDANQFVTLGGYYLAGTAYVSPGRDTTGGPTTMRQAALSLATVIDRMHEGRGGLLTAGTLNRVGSDGQVDGSDPDYTTLLELIQIAAGVVTGPSSGWDLALSIIDGASLATTDPGGPYDWTNVRALPELIDLLAQIGWTASLTSDGSTLRVYRLPWPGETLTLPAIITDNALPYRLDDAPSNRSKYIVVTSGRTRTTVLTRRDLSDLEWVYYDERTSAWLNQAEHDALYPSEIGPSDITALKAGTGNDQEKNSQLNRVFSALRLKNDPDPQQLQDLRNASRFAVLPGEFDFDGKRMSGTPAFIEAKYCVEGEGGQFSNHPADIADDPIRIDVDVLSGEGVFVLPTRRGEPLMARVDTTLGGGETKNFSSLRELATGELTVYFAHEADTGDDDIDYARAVFRCDEVGGSIDAVLVTDPTERTAAIEDTASVVIEQPSIRRVVQWEPGDLVYTELNEAELLAIMEQYAQFRAGAELVKAGQIELDGFHDIDPGDAGGAVSSVVYDLNNRTTIVTINQHEVPQSVFTRLEQQTQRSLASGLGRFRTPGSSAGVLDVRAGSTPGDAAALPPNAGIGTAELDPAQGAATRGADKAAGTRRAVRSHAIRPEARFDRNVIHAVFTGATVASANKWEYDWAEVEFDDAGSYTKKGRTSATLGKAYNRAELGNTGSGTQPDGIDPADLLGTFAKKPIGEGQCVRLTGPYRASDGSPYWLADAVQNQYFGECPA